MARTVNPEEFASRRKEILNAAQRLMFTKGYDQMSIRDILNELQISSGAFHHYFGSREALLDAFIEQIKQETEKPLLPIINDPHRSAIQKLQGFFDTLDRLRMDNKVDILKLARIWYTDANAVVRLKVEEAVFEQRAPLLANIVRQGVQEGVFTTIYPDQAGEVILSLLQGMGSKHARLLFSLEQGRDEANCIDAIVKTHGAYMDALERMLGAPPNCIYRINAEMVKELVILLREDAGEPAA